MPNHKNYTRKRRNKKELTARKVKRIISRQGGVLIVSPRGGIGIRGRLRACASRRRAGSSPAGGIELTAQGLCGILVIEVPCFDRDARRVLSQHLHIGSQS